MSDNNDPKTGKWEKYVAWKQENKTRVGKEKKKMYAETNKRKNRGRRKEKGKKTKAKKKEKWRNLRERRGEE